MNGSEKQITWANEIKEGKMQDFAELQSKVISPIGTKALDYIKGLDAASYWIDNRDRSAADMLKSLLRGGLAINGNQSSDKATMDPTSGIITITSKAIVQDGKGGHYETTVKTI
jgi:hypothetical protein